jgi:zinc protease
MLVFDGRPAQGHTLDELEQAVRTEIERLKEELVSEQELDRVKAQVVAADVYSRDSIFYQAMRIGMLETTGRDWRLIDDYVDRIQAVTAVQVRQVAQRYLVDTNLTVAVLEPLPISQRPQRSRAASGGRHVN